MTTSTLIARKRDGQELSEAQIATLVRDYTNGTIPDYQMAAFCMAVYFRGLTPRETLTLTRCMVESGEVMSWHHLPGPTVDKHSTGGVGDKTSLVVAPLVAAAGSFVPMISGRSLGFSGGTLDKLEAIPGFEVQLSPSHFRRVVEKCGCVLAGQTTELAPADRKLYALRDATATVECIPLICASILSKKLAEGTDGLVLDVKVGEGAFMRTVEEASQLAGVLTDVGNGMGTQTIALITDMNQPLGRAVGNALEVREAIETLKGEGPEDLLHLSEKIASRMLALGGHPEELGAARAKVSSALESGQALDRLRRVVEAQGGDARVVDHPDLLPTARFQQDIPADRDGFVAGINPRTIGQVVMSLGAGRDRMSDTIDHSVGVVLRKKVGDPVHRSESLCTVHYNESSRFEAIREIIVGAFAVQAQRSDPPMLIKAVVD
ncbi:MAG: thymidine phosphorylase [Acidobacteriota bacterium]